MKTRLLSVALAGLVILLAPPGARAQGDAEALREAKTLFFDREYAKARAAWQAVAVSGSGADARAARYWIARCSEKLDEPERALAEYGDFLAKGATDPTLREEAETSRVALAAKLYKRGVTKHAGVLHRALESPSRTVRYFAGLQLGALGPDVCPAAVPVLKQIIMEETDEDLVERAKLALLRCDRRALAEAAPSPAPGGKPATWIRLRIWEKGSKEPQVSINLPVALAEMVFKSLPEDALRELRKEGYDAGSFWERLKKTGPTEILTIDSDDGDRIQVWIE